MIFIKSTKLFYKYKNHKILILWFLCKLNFLSHSTISSHKLINRILYIVRLCYFRNGTNKIGMRLPNGISNCSFNAPNSNNGSLTKLLCPIYIRNAYRISNGFCLCRKNRPYPNITYSKCIQYINYLLQS